MSSEEHCNTEIKRLKAECKRLANALYQAQREVCEFATDFKRNKLPFYGLPQEYAEIRDWICYTPTGKPRTETEEVAQQGPEP